MKRILVPIDFSDESMNAVEYAARLAQELESSLTLLHVQHKNIEERTGGTSTAGVNELLDETSEGVTRAFHISCSYRIADAPGETLASAIASASSDHDMVVMGSNGAETVIQKFLGTHTWRVSQQLDIPLILVPEGVSFKRIDHILLAVNVTKAPAFIQLLRLASIFNSRIHMLHVENATYQKYSTRELGAVAEKIIRNVDQFCDISFNVIFDEDTSRGILNHMLENNWDLLALSIERSVDKPTHPSISKEITANASFPIFLFHH